MALDKADQQVKNLKSRGVAMPRNAARARAAAAEMHGMALQRGDLQKTIGDAVGGANTTRQMQENKDLIANMRANRMARTSSAAGGDVYAAIPRFYDPMEYWDLSGLPWNMADEGHRHKLQKWLRLFYATHYLVPILIDIFTRFPLVGMDLESKDPQIERFYEDLFLDQLDYPEFLVQLGREYWTVGEAFPLGSFDESLGIWEHEELLNPADITIENFPLLGSQQLKILPPEDLKRLAQQKSPAKEYKMLEMNFPEIIPYLRKNEKIPISGVLLKQVANKLSSWDDHGTPILLRGLRTLMHEEKLLASQDAIAERLYSPLILAKLGLLDIGDGQGPWFPPPDELDAFRDDLDLALSSDFRVIVHHLGLEMENVFGREQMPRLGDDFDRIERRIMQIFGVNPSLLSAGAASQPYASSALQAEFLNQILRTFQGYLKKHFKARAMVIAEAHEHYEYETRGETRIPVMEEVVVYDEEGNKSIETRNKLLIPDMKFQTLDLRDEATERQFLQTLRSMGVPIPDSKLMVGIDYEIEDMVEEYNQELVQKTIKQQEAKMKAATALSNANLPVPPDLAAEVGTVLNQGPGQSAPAGGGGLPGMPSGAGGPGGPPGMGGPSGPGGEAIVMPPPPPGLGPGGPPGTPGGAVPGGGPPPTAPNGQGIGGGFAPPASFERRPGIPTPTSSLQNGQKSAKVDDKSEDESDTKEESTEDEIVETLPRAKKGDDGKPKKRYTFIEPGAGALEDESESEEE